MKYPIINKKPQAHFLQSTPSYNLGMSRQGPTETSQPRNLGRGKGNNNLPLSFEQYSALAQAIMEQGDQVLAEIYYQYAEHALRVSDKGSKHRRMTGFYDTELSSQNKAPTGKDFETSLKNELEEA